MGLAVLDAAGNQQTLSTTQNPADADNLVGSTAVTDPSSGLKQAVGQTHAADAQADSGNSALVNAVPALWNGASFDRQRNNVDLSAILTLTTQAVATINGSTNTNFNHRGVQIGVNITAISASTTLTIEVQGKDAASGTWYTLLTSAALNAAAFTLLTVYPGATVTANISLSTPLPRTWRVVGVVAGSGTVTATVGASMIG